MKIRTAITTAAIAAALTFGIATPATAVTAPHHVARSYTATIVQTTGGLVVGAAHSWQVRPRYDRSAFAGVACGHTYVVRVMVRKGFVLQTTRAFLKVTTCKGQWTR